MSTPGPYTSKDVVGLSSGSQFWGKFIITGKNQRKTRGGGDIIILQLADSLGVIEAVVWESCKIHGELEKGAVIGILADIGQYNNRQQITAKRIRILEEDPSLYLRSAPIPRETMIAELQELVVSFDDPHLTVLLQTILTPQCVAEFSLTPAAKRVHHHYVGGLLEHTLQVARLCHHTARLYPLLNRDLLVTGAILHDIGKMEEYRLQAGPEYTLEGKLLGHVVMGYQCLDRAIRKLRQEGYDFPALLETILKHLILSHHGSLEFGSPVKPLSPEAFVLHTMDNMDAKLFVYFEKIIQGESLDDYLTPYDSFHQQQFFTYRYEADALKGQTD